MSRRSPPPRSRPRPADAAPQLDGAALSRQDHSATSDAATPVPSSPVASADSADPSRDWRAKLAALAQATALTPEQEAGFFRLFQAQETEMREAMPRLLDELKPHFETEGEAAAKERFTQALHALKRKQEDEVSRLLASMGIESQAPRAG